MNMYTMHRSDFKSRQYITYIDIDDDDIRFKKLEKYHFTWFCKSNRS